MLENFIDELPMALGISPVNKHRKQFHGRQMQIKQKLTRLQVCLEVSIYTNNNITGLPWEWNFHFHSHLIPTGFLWGSSYGFPFVFRYDSLSEFEYLLYTVSSTWGSPLLRN